MKSQYDVVIIGGGVIGVCSAYYLSKQGAKVLLIERGEIASGCSYGNGGLIVPSHAVPLASPGALGSGLRWLMDAESPFYIRPRWDMDLFRWLFGFVGASRRDRMLRRLPAMRDLLVHSRALYDEIGGQEHFDFGFEGQGALYVFLTDTALQAGAEEAHLLEAHGIPARLLGSSEVHDLEPALLPGVVGGVYYPRDGHIDPQRFVCGLADRAREGGATILTRTEVIGFDVGHGRIGAIRTTRGDLYADQVVMAAGSWSPALARLLRLRVPIQAAKGYSLTLQTPEVSPRLPLLFGEVPVVANPLGDRLRLAGMLELAGMDLSIDMRRVAAIRRAADRYLPGLAQAGLIEIWRGLRPCTPDGLPLLGRSGVFGNLVIAAGHAMLGMSLGPVTGKIVSQLVAAEQTDLDLAPFDPQRF